MQMKQFTWLFFICLCTIVNVLSKEDVLSDKVQQLTDWSLKKSLIRLNSERFKHFVRTPPRNYSMIVMLTALSPQRQCAVCKQAHEEFEVVAQSYRYSNVFSNKLFFAMVDFDEGSEVFQYLKLNTAPVFIHFPPKTKHKKSDQMDIGRKGFSAEQLAKWVQERTEVKIQIYRPPNYSGLLIIALSIIMIGGLLYSRRDSLGFLFSNLVWGVFVILAVCICISGQVWNSIRGAHFVHRDGNTGQVVFLLYFGVCAGMILLNEAPKIRSRTGKRKAMMAIVGIVMVIFLFSFLLSIFRAKYQGYPYSFLIK